MNKFKIIRVLIYSLFILPSSFYSVHGQTSTASPYSRYGIGDLQFGGFAKNLGMGGTSLAVASPFSINFSNPASYGLLNFTTFEAAGVADFYEVKNSSANGYLNNVSLGYFALAFPIKPKKIGLSFGLLPYSNMGYDISSQQTNVDGDVENHKYQGSGGLDQFYIGAGWSPFKNFSIGVNTSFMFGTLQQLQRVDLPYNDNYYNTKVTESTVINDFYFNFGILKTFDSLKVAHSDSLQTFEKGKKNINDSLNRIKNLIHELETISGKDGESFASQEAKMTVISSSLHSQYSKEDSLQMLFQKEMIVNSDTVRMLKREKEETNDSLKMIKKILKTLENGSAKDTLPVAKQRERDSALTAATAASALLQKELISTDSLHSVAAMRKKSLAKSDSIKIFEKKKEAINDSLKYINGILDDLKTAESKGNISLKQFQDEMKTTTLLLHSEIFKIDSASRRVVGRIQKSDWSVSVGATLAPTTKLRGSHSVLVQSYIYSDLTQTQETIKDTIQNINDKNGYLVLPLSLGTGICVKKGTRWTFASDFSVQDWQDYSLFGEKDSLANSWRLSAGMQYVPNDRNIKSYFSLVQYRLGFHYEQTFLQLHNTQLNDEGVSIGFGFPMKRAATVVQMSFEAGRLGTVANNLIQLNYLKCSVAFTINDRWFVKSKFD